MIFKKKHICEFNKIVRERYEMKENDVEVIWDKEDRSE